MWGYVVYVHIPTTLLLLLLLTNTIVSVPPPSLIINTCNFFFLDCIQSWVYSGRKVSSIHIIRDCGTCAVYDEFFGRRRHITEFSLKLGCVEIGRAFNTSYTHGYTSSVLAKLLCYCSIIIQKENIIILCVQHTHKICSVCVIVLVCFFFLIKFIILSFSLCVYVCEIVCAYVYVCCIHVNNITKIRTHMYIGSV